jgi:hypothetical protein
MGERLLVRSLMAEDHFRRVLVPGEHTGREGRYAWTVRVSRAGETWATGHPADTWGLYRVSYQVLGPHGAVRVQTWRLAREPVR